LARGRGKEREREDVSMSAWHGLGSQGKANLRKEETGKEGSEDENEPSPKSRFISSSGTPHVSGYNR
jgi:hypothetical protein